MVEFLLGLLAGILITILAGLYFGKKIEEKEVERAESLMRAFYKNEETNKLYKGYDA